MMNIQTSYKPAHNTVGSLSGTASGSACHRAANQANGFNPLDSTSGNSQLLPLLLQLVQLLLQQLQGQAQGQEQSQGQQQPVTGGNSQGSTTGNASGMTTGNTSQNTVNTSPANPASTTATTTNDTTMSADQIDSSYADAFRTRMLENTRSIGNGWDLAEAPTALAHLKDPAALLKFPEVRNYTNSQGNAALEIVLERNNLWEVVVRDGQRHLVTRQTDNNGQPVQSAAALRDLFNNRQDYAFDCATPMTILNLKSSLDLLGDAEFNKANPQLDLSGWYDQQDGNMDGGYNGSTLRRANAGDITVNGNSNLQGEYAMFDPAHGDELIPGNAYYFEKPGDNSSIEQGWNAIYLGQNDDGSQSFWSSSMGEMNIDFADDSWTTNIGLESFYLAAVISSPNFTRLQSWDLDQSLLFA